MSGRTLAAGATAALVGILLVLALVPATCQAAKPKVVSLSRSHAKGGAKVTIRGNHFGPRQGKSTVTFGERPNELGFAPCSKKARILSWKRSSITVRVPMMSPGKVGVPQTHHRIYITVGSRKSNSVDFCVDPAIVITKGARTTLANSVIPASNSTWSAGTGTFRSTSDTGVFPADGTDSVLFDGVTFTATDTTLAGYAFGVLTLGCNRTHQNLTFLNCTFSNNVGPGGGGDYGVNGVKVVNWGDEYCHDVSFVGCDFGTPDGGASAFSRMGYEQVQDEPVNAATNIGIIDCTFEPVDGEAVSYNAGDLMALIAGCTFKGSGNRVNADYVGVFEANGGCFIEVRNTEMWRPSGPAINIGSSYVEGVNRHLLFKRLTIDASHAYQNVPLSGECMFMCSELSWARFAACRFNTGTASAHYRWAGAADTWGDPPHAWNTCTYNDFSGSTISGYVESGRPKVAAGYWDSGVHPTNKLPSVAR